MPRLIKPAGIRNPLSRCSRLCSLRRRFKGSFPYISDLDVSGCYLEFSFTFYGNTQHQKKRNSSVCRYTRTGDCGLGACSIQYDPILTQNIEYDLFYFSVFWEQSQNVERPLIAVNYTLKQPASLENLNEASGKTQSSRNILITSTGLKYESSSM